MMPGATGILEAAATHDVRIGLHTLSAVNIAEVSPFVRDAVDRYLESYYRCPAIFHGGRCRQAETSGSAIWTPPRY